MARVHECQLKLYTSASLVHSTRLHVRLVHACVSKECHSDGTLTPIVSAGCRGGNKTPLAAEAGCSPAGAHRSTGKNTHQHAPATAAPAATAAAAMLFGALLEMFFLAGAVFSDGASSSSPSSAHTRKPTSSQCRAQCRECCPLCPAPALAHGPIHVQPRICNTMLN
jgi:hypothetical protein